MPRWSRVKRFSSSFRRCAFPAKGSFESFNADTGKLLNLFEQFN